MDTRKKFFQKQCLRFTSFCTLFGTLKISFNHGQFTSNLTRISIFREDEEEDLLEKIFESRQKSLLKPRKQRSLWDISSNRFMGYTRKNNFKVM
jgi:hypothetical protein